MTRDEHSKSMPTEHEERSGNVVLFRPRAKIDARMQKGIASGSAELRACRRGEDDDPGPSAA